MRVAPHVRIIFFVGLNCSCWTFGLLSFRARHDFLLPLELSMGLLFIWSVLCSRTERTLAIVSYLTIVFLLLYWIVSPGPPAWHQPPHKPSASTMAEKGLKSRPVPVQRAMGQSVD